MLLDIEEIHKGQVIKENGACTVVRVGSFVVKYGKGVSLAEVDSLSFVASNTSIPVPKVYDSYNQGGITYIVMEYVPGDNLEHVWCSLSSAEKEKVSHSLREYLEQLRKHKSQTYGGSNNRSFEHGLFRCWSGEPGGPFNSEKDLVEALFRNTGASNEMLSRLHQLSDCLHGHEAVFTHGDMQRKNILFERHQLGFKLTLIDWEVSGFYPAWWEYDSAMCPRPTDDWVDYLPNIVGNRYVYQHLFMQSIRPMFF
ncbi:MAG: hypothetical protein M1814_002327 [Vezdaea aestivalis]|nr:MAG: hypothetical protein M1814_002327 [Vezdaea aestivalis]